jgi:hypothetical protein
MKKLKSRKLGSSLAGAILLGTLAALPLRAQNYPTLLQAQAPFDWWRFEETTPSPAVNVISNHGSVGAIGTGYVVDGALTGVPGIVGNAVLLSNPGDTVGDCLTRIDIPNVAALNPEPPFTIEFWAKPTTLSSDSTGVCILSSLSPFPGTTSRSGYLFYENTAAYTFRLGGENSYTATATSATAPAAGTWAHIVGEFDGTTITIFINGVLSGNSTANESAPYHVNTWVATRIGGTSLLGGEYVDQEYGGGAYYTGNRGFDGAVDEFAIYNYLLSSNTVAAHYHAATTNAAGYDALIEAANPVGYWNMDEPTYTPPPSNTYTFAADSGSTGDNGTNTLGTVADQPGVPGLSALDKSVVYNGAAGSLVLDTNVTPPDVAGGPMSLVAWIKPLTFGYVSEIICQGYSEETYSENFLSAGDSYDWEAFSDNNSGGNYNTNVVPDVPFYEIGTYNGGAGYVSAVFPAPAGDLGHWVFLVGTYDGAQWNLYRNGALVGVFADGGVGPSEVAPLPWSVGSRDNPNEYFGQFFCGSIAEPAIFATTLDAGTISNLYNSVGLPPVITEAPVAPSPAYLGSSASFSVWADGPGTLHYQWYSNSVAVAGQTATNYSLTGLIAADSATYSVVVTNLYGSVTSSAVLVVTPTLPPVTIVPAAETRWLGSPLSFAPASLPNQQLAYQWDLNGHAIGGATLSSYTATTTLGTVGSYTLIITNSFGAATSSVATLAALPIPTNTEYPSTILGDHPLSYFRLDEHSGTIAYDYAGGNNGNYYGDITLGVPGYSLIDTDTAVYFPGVANSYVGDIGATTIDFAGTAAEFSIEAWANGSLPQVGDAAVIAKGEGNNGGTANEQFAISVVGGVYVFFVRDPKNAASQVTSTFAPDGNWHHLVGVCDAAGNALTFYIDGVPVGQTTPPTTGLITSTAGVSIGAERSGVLPPYDWPYTGTIDEVAIYSYPLSALQVSNHFAARYGSDTAPFITAQPVSVTNYISLPVTLSVSAAGSVPLSYQWNMTGSGPIAGATDPTYTIPNLAYGNAGTYTVGITNTLAGNVVTGILSAPVTITVLAPPTNPPSIPGLVMHLTFDNTLVDATGRGNNATNEASGGATLQTNDYEGGQIGQAFTYQTSSNGVIMANYASVGVRPDLQFGSNSFTVSMWVQYPPNYIGGDLPFFTDVIGSTFGFPGYCFEPSFGYTVGTTAGWPGAWGFSVYDSTDAGTGVYGPDGGDMNDGNWHSLVYVIDKTAGATVYQDGLVSAQFPQAGNTVAGIGDIDSTNSATIGQDPTGQYVQVSQGTFGIDDLGVWRRALKPLEAASIYMAGAVNQISFAGAPLTFTHQVLPGHVLVLTWNEGDLQSATSLSGPWTTLSVTSPYTTSPTAEGTYYRIKF